jgi:hypothetical protein
MRSFRAAALAVALGAPLAASADPTTVVSGKAFVDYTYKSNYDSGKNAPADKAAGTGLDLKRFYLGVDHTFDETFDARIRTDVGNLTNGKIDVFVKHAFIEAKVAPELALKAGAADLPWVPFVEDLYGFRYVENVMVDRAKFGTSADWGLHAGGKLAGGLLSYAASAVNGRGYGDFTRTQAPTAEARLSVAPVTGLTVAVGGVVGKIGQNTVGAVVPRTAQRYDALVAWNDSALRLGVEGFYAVDYGATIVTGVAAEDKALGLSGWASYALASSVTLFARADYVQPKRTTASSLKDVYLNAGLQYAPVKPLALALVYKNDTVKDGTLGTSNGTIGSTVAGAKGSYNELGVFAQYAF